MKIILFGSPITTNSLYATMCRGNFPNRYMTTRGKKLKESYQWQAKAAYKGPQPLTGPLEIDVKLYFGTKRKCDIDNFNKILFDSLTGIVWVDDSQIIKSITEKRYDKDNPRIEIDVLKTLTQDY